MEGATPPEKAALLLMLAAAASVASLVEPDGYIDRPALTFGAFLAGLVASLVALALAVRTGRPRWLRWAAGAGAALFAGAAGWLVYFLSRVPLS